MRNHKVRIILPELQRQKIVRIAHKNLLQRIDSQIATKYLLSEYRGFNQNNYRQVVEKYKLGYMPTHVVNEYGDYHQFSGRLLIPINDQYGNLIAISSRDLRQDTKQKFLHQSFNKSIYLYGLDSAKKTMIQKNYVIIVQGQFDTIYLQMNGFENTVGILGSAMHMQQVSLIKRYCNNVFFLLDGDKSGKHAATKYIDKFRYLTSRSFMQMYSVNLPKGYDPDQFIKKHGKQALIELMKQSKQIL